MPSVRTPRPEKRFLTTLWSAAAVSTIAALASAPVTAVAQSDPNVRLKKVERERKANQRRHTVLEREADGAAAEIKKLKRRMVRIADETQAQEGAVSALEIKIRELDGKISRATESLETRREQMAAMLAALERLSRHPPVALAARPGHPVDTVRSAILMRTAIPALETRSKALTRELSELASLREDVSRKRSELAKAGRALKNKRKELARLIDRKARLERRARTRSWAAKARAATLAAEAKDLKDLLSRLEAERLAALERKRREAARRSAELEQARRDAERKAAEERELAEQMAAERKKAERERADREKSEREKSEREKAEREIAEREAEMSSTVALATPKASPDRPGSSLVALPARGRVVRKFGQRTGFGGASKGLRIETRPSAQVTAPRQGNVVFAGPFRGYGLLVIIRHDDGHHALLSGMAQIQAAVGDRVLAGEPVGLMGPSTGGKPTLYLELRRKGQPVNPLPWLTAGRSKVSG